LGVCWITFKIYIPARVQEEVANEFAPGSTGTENFSVHIHYAYEGPVAFVTLDGPEDGERDPSAAVRVVREFLRRELNPVNTPIRFECIGPSPFHADCSLTLIAPAAPRKGEFAVKRVSRHGYDLLQFTSNHFEYNDAKAAAGELFNELENELGFYYEVMRSELESGQAWESIQSEVNLLVKTSKDRGFWNRAVASMKRSRKLHDVFTSLIIFDVSRTFLLNQRNEGYRDTYSADGGFLRLNVDRVIQGTLDYPTKQVTTLVGFLERRRSKALELGVVLMVGVVGGIASLTLSRLPFFQSNATQGDYSSRSSSHATGAVVTTPSPKADIIAPEP
jgi:hypothetical protein